MHHVRSIATAHGAYRFSMLFSAIRLALGKRKSIAIEIIKYRTILISGCPKSKHANFWKKIYTSAILSALKMTHAKFTKLKVNSQRNAACGLGKKLLHLDVFSTMLSLLDSSRISASPNRPPSLSNICAAP